jgi:SulP family sulfate permease
MGYTKIAGTPVITGLYTILIPMALFAVFGSSRHLVVGADSATAAILAAGLAGLAATGSDEYVALAAVLAFMAAGFLILARIIGLGFLADFLSRTVLVGFLTGVGIQVALGEISGMLGLKGGGHGTLGKIWNDYQQIEQVNFYALAVALSVLVVIVGSKKVSKKIPGALIAVIGAIVFGWALDLKAHVHVLGAVPSGLPHIGLPEVKWSWELIGKLVPTAFAMFVVILAQSAATSRAYAARYNERFSENTDLASAVDDVDYTAAETLRSLFGILKEKGIRLVLAQVLDDVKAKSRYHLGQIFGEEAFYETLGDVVKDFRQQTGKEV